MAFIEPMHRNKPNITYLLTFKQVTFLTADPSITNDLGCENSICWFGRDITRKVRVTDGRTEPFIE